MQPILTQGRGLFSGDIPKRREQFDAGVPTASDSDLASLDARVTTLESAPASAGASRAKGRFVYG